MIETVLYTNYKSSYIHVGREQLTHIVVFVGWKDIPES